MHARLTRNTRDAHRKAEHALNVPLAFSSRDNYAALLARLWSVHEAYEQRLASMDWRSQGIAFESRRRARWLAEDLAALGVPRSIPVKPLARIATIEEGLGCLYVLEGSSLGQQILLRKALRLPDVSVARCTRFLHGHGSSTRAMWDYFVDVLNTYPSVGNAATQIERGALEAFRNFSVALKQDVHPESDAADSDSAVAGRPSDEVVIRIAREVRSG